MIGHKHEIPQLQSDMYRKSYHNMLRWLFIAILIMILLVLAIVYLELFSMKPSYYASTTSGQIIPLRPDSGA